MAIVGRILRWVVSSAGVAALLVFALCWTPLPWRMYHWLWMPDAELTEAPDWIVVLGGGGIPSESGLMRTYYAAQAADAFPSARVMVALPGDPNAAEGALQRMRDELVMRGVDRSRIAYEPTGSNTRSQAVALRRQWGAVETMPVLIVTSPEHMRRAIRTFERAGFARTGGTVASNTGVDHSLAVSEDGVDDSFTLLSVEGNLFVRYHFWHSLTYLTRSAREWAALLYYRSKGWI